VTTFFCPECWGEVAPGAPTCPGCGSDLRALDEAAYADKLRRALWHPEGFTARRAAWLLGQRREPAAVGALAERAREGCGVYLAVGIADALAAIDTHEARVALDGMRKRERRPLVQSHLDALLAHGIER
jgi:hypothetical protein